MTRSMTGYASVTGQGGGWSWSWDLRSVNGRGLDLRLRVPEWIEGLEAAVRAALQGDVARGTVTLTLRLGREGGDAGLDRAALEAAVAQVRAAEEVAQAKGLALRPVRASDLLAMRQPPAASPETTAELRARLLADLPGLLAEFEVARRREGGALAAVIEGQLATVDDLIARAKAAAEAQQAAAPERIRAAVARVIEVTDAIDEARLMQEVALIAVRADVTEELDRLAAHVAAARSLLSESAPKGRKLDFLLQELNRETNTLCSKSQSQGLTRVGLDLKAVIDQMREQVQNVE